MVTPPPFSEFCELWNNHSWGALPHTLTPLVHPGKFRDNTMPHFINLDRMHYPPRPANARAELEKILCALVEDYGAEKIIAFGSTVRGGVTEHSDFDLCVIREHPPGCTHPTLEARQAAGRYSPLVSKDILVKSPAQYRSEAMRPVGAMQEVVEHGLTVYERCPQ